ncbi:MAG: hypothetical protein AAGF91_15710 [Actinomycetota bacterium]
MERDMVLGTVRAMGGGSLLGGVVGGALGLFVFAMLAGCDSGESGAGETAVAVADEPTVSTLFDFVDGSPGEVVGLVANDAERRIEWADRLDGTIRSLSIDDPEAEPEVVATIDVGTDGEQRGLVGHAVLDDRRFVSFTRPDTADTPFELVVAEIMSDGEVRPVFSAGAAGSGAIGGPIEFSEGGRLLVGIGRNTGWDGDSGVGGAILALDPNAGAEQGERIVSQGYTNPWAFTSLPGGGGIGLVWVWDNAAGADPLDESIDDIERIGRADLQVDRQQMRRIEFAGRAPSDMVELPDGRLGVCGFLDNEMRAYEMFDTDDPMQPILVRAGTIMPCLTGAAVFDDGTIVTAAQTDAGEALLIRR